MTRKTLISLMVLAATSSAMSAQPGGRINVAVMPLRGSDISETEARFLTERLAIELQRTGAFEVLERDKMDEILREQGFQQTGACDETACLVEAGRLLPVHKIIGGSAGKVGNVYSAQIRLIDLQTGKVEKTATRDYKGELEALLTSGMRESAEELAGRLKPQEAAAQPRVTPQTEAMMRGFLETQYEDKSKSKGWATVWSIIPGCGNLYAKNYGAAALFFAAGITAHSTYANADDKSGLPAVVLLSVRVADWVVAMRSVDRYNARLRKKLGLTYQLQPYPDGFFASLTASF